MPAKVPVVQQVRECKASANEINSWKRNLQKSINKGHKQGILWSIEDAQELGLAENHPDVMAAKSALVALPTGEGSHPSRTEITAMEPPCARWAEGSLAKAMVYGDASDFEVAMGEFIESTEFHPSGMPQDKDMNLSSRSSTCSTASTSSRARDSCSDSADGSKLVLGPSRNEQKKATCTVVLDLWRSADIDGNGQLSQIEARETLRVLLSRPQLRTALGEPLKTVTTDRMADHVNFREVLDLHDELSDCLSYMVHERVLRLCKHAVSKSCLDVARNLHDVTDSFWAALDLNKNGEVDKNEFIKSFEDAIHKVVLHQLWNRAEERAWKMVEAGCWKCTTTEQMDGMMRAYKEKEKRKKKEPVFATSLQQLPSAKDEAGEFCQGGDCIVM
eukprot:gnl/MRDRNA2_/MRDRNA2_95854_c0_seq1.p1 gnl/MRDRNA2_/MRDRNA2_95854_c0~~gnl/MRDRNA2_/MRDRNA2_95854_c0_seq1.p1  ORF type:complete len:389 (+),score=87.85 gnl/MRDRNA2_/MRDRNA2_95854_c0_seq1:96-1262(+)